LLAAGGGDRHRRVPQPSLGEGRSIEQFLVLPHVLVGWRVLLGAFSGGEKGDAILANPGTAWLSFILGPKEPSEPPTVWPADSLIKKEGFHISLNALSGAGHPRAIHLRDLVGLAAYRLDLPDGSAVFHVSQLKDHIPNNTLVYTSLPSSCLKQILDLWLIKRDKANTLKLVELVGRSKFLGRHANAILALSDGGDRDPEFLEQKYLVKDILQVLSAPSLWFTATHTMSANPICRMPMALPHPSPIPVVCPLFSSAATAAVADTTRRRTHLAPLLCMSSVRPTVAKPAATPPPPQLPPPLPVAGKFTSTSSTAIQWVASIPALCMEAKEDDGISSAAKQKSRQNAPLDTDPDFIPIPIPIRSTSDEIPSEHTTVLEHPSNAHMSGGFAVWQSNRQ
ncbi:hypothetical protein E2562_000288, partial [Oryza meyeriana var. granulata]